MLEIGIVGGGAAGLTAACAAAEENPACRILLWEKMPVCGKKICITGKGRCNVTNDSTPAEVSEKILQGGRFLRTALYAFPPSAVMEFFENEGVPLKTERGRRVFPVSDKAGDIAEALRKKAFSYGNVRLCRETVLSVEKAERFLVKTGTGGTFCDRLILATGGLSYPGCGSTGDGFRFARALGHTVTPLVPGLVPLLTEEADAAEMMGLSLKNAAITVTAENGKKVYADFGEMLFCHFGVSGPVILSASSRLSFASGERYRLSIDLKPALSFEELDARLLRDFSENRNRDFLNSLSALLPQKMIPVAVRRSGIDPHKKVNAVTREERHALCRLLKDFSFTLTGTRPVKEAIITRGGVALSEIDPRTLSSKLVPGLYFAGEMLDADAPTGGYNLQIAFSTGHLAGKKAATEETL